MQAELSAARMHFTAQGLKDAGEGSRQHYDFLSCLHSGVQMERNEESVQDNRLSQQQMSSLGRAAADDQEAHVCLRMLLRVTVILRWGRDFIRMWGKRSGKARKPHKKMTPPATFLPCFASSLPYQPTYCFPSCALHGLGHPPLCLQAIGVTSEGTEKPGRLHHHLSPNREAPFCWFVLPIMGYGF